MNAKSKKSIIIFCSVTAAFLAAIVICTFFDLQISEKITIIGAGKFYPESVLGRFFETFGVIPVYAFTAFALSVVFHNVYRRSAEDKNDKILRGTLLGLSAFLVALMCYAMFKKVIKYVAIHFDFEYTLGGVLDHVAYVLLGLMSGAALLYFTKDLFNSYLNKTLCWALVVIFTAAFSQLIVQSVKSFSGRARYATMNVLEDFSLYTPWYKFKAGRTVSDEMLTLGVGSDGFKSFPSGHSAAAAMSLLFCVCPLVLKTRKKPIKILLIALPIVFTLGTMISRVVEGAHFATDVLFGCYSVLLGAYIAFLFIPAELKKLKPLGEKIGVICESVEKGE